MRTKAFSILTACLLAVFVVPKSATAGGCEICLAQASDCSIGFQTVCIDWNDPIIGDSCSSWYEPMCEEMALSVQDVDAAGLLLSTVDADIVALNGEDVRRACDGAVLGYHFDAEDDSSFESSTKVITI